MEKTKTKIYRQLFKAFLIFLCLLSAALLVSCRSDPALEDATKGIADTEIEGQGSTTTEIVSQSVEGTASSTTLRNQESVKPSNLFTPEQLRQILEAHNGVAPAIWSEKMPGIVDTFPAKEKELALTFDACGGKYGSQVDSELMAYLQAEQVSATLFVNRRWIESNPALFLELAANPLFEIENHGNEHRPLCVTPRTVYGIEGTDSPERVADEILLNEKTIYDLTGRRTKFFRSGTAYYDDVAVRIAADLGYQIAGFQVNGDAGATFTADQIVTSMERCKSGDIVICHFNQPQKQTFEGLQQVIPKLKAEGFTFVKLEERLLPQTEPTY